MAYDNIDPNGIRTRVTAVKGRCPRPLDDRVLKDSYGCTKSEVRKRKFGIGQMEKKNLPQRPKPSRKWAHPDSALLSHKNRLFLEASSPIRRHGRRLRWRVSCAIS
jgi:hypothetical protein